MNIAVCIASGPSLTREDVEFCKGKAKVYAVKEAYLLAPWADVLYCADFDWWDMKKGVPEFAGEKWTVAELSAKRWGIHHIPGTASIDWGHDDKLIAYGGNSGFQALNLAVVQGAKKVILLGYDYGHTALQPKHWFDNTEHRRDSRRSDYKSWIERMNTASKMIPVPVINASRQTALECFQRKTIEEAFNE